jgi:hypothetical protein
MSHDVYEEMIFAFNTTDTQFEVCQLDYLVPVTYYVVGVNADEVGEPSDTLTVQWVFNFDFDNNGVVGISDFGVFCQDYGAGSLRSDSNDDGIVSIIDFGAFVQRFGECNDGVKANACS